MNVRLKVPCPYCGHKNVITATSDHGERILVCCDPMEGGCESWYVAKLTVDIRTEVFKVAKDGGEV